MAAAQVIPPPPMGPVGPVGMGLPPPPPIGPPMQGGGGAHGMPPQQMMNGFPPQHPGGNFPQHGGNGMMPNQMQGMGQSGKGGDQSKSQQKPNSKTVYKYFQVRKPSARDVELGIKPNWIMAKASEVPMTSAQVEEKVRAHRNKAKYSAIEEYNNLSPILQQKADDVLRTLKVAEKDQSMEWSVAAIETEKVKLIERGRQVQEIGQMRVYVKRTLDPNYTGGNKSAGGQGGQGQQQFGGQKQNQGGQQGGNMQGNFGGGMGQGQNGFPNGGPVGNMPLPPPIPGMPNSAINMPGQAGPFPVKVKQINTSGGKKKKSKRRGSRRSKHHDYQSDSDSDSSSDGDSDSSSDASTNATRDTEEDIDDLRDDVHHLTRRLKDLGRRGSKSWKRRGSSHSYFPPVPMGVHRRPSMEYPRPLLEHSGPQYVRQLPAPPQGRVAMVERFHYDNGNESDGITDGSGHSVNSWVGGQSAFSRPPSDPYTPPRRHSPDDRYRRSQDFPLGNPGFTFREHSKPARKPSWYSPPLSPRDSGHSLHRRSSKEWLSGNGYTAKVPGLSRTQTLPQYSTSDLFSQDFNNQRRKSSQNDYVRRNTEEAMDHIRAKQRQDDAYRRAEEGRHGNNYNHRY